MAELTLLRLVYTLNMVAAGGSGLVNLAGPALASELLWEGRVGPSSIALPLLGSVWVTVAVLSAAGWARPLAFSALPLFQLIYKSIFLGLVVLPAWLKTGSTGVPSSMIIIFGAYIPLLAAAIPWSRLLGSAEKGRAKAE